MALFKIGTKIIDEVEYGVYLLQGNAVRDGEYKEVNKKSLGKVSVAAKPLNNGETMFVTVSAWREKAEDVAAIRKLDSVLAVGTLRKREYNERVYWDLDADFVCVSGVRRNGRAYTAVEDSPDCGFEAVDEEAGELPF
jgi:hypothetical protein